MAISATWQRYTLASIAKHLKDNLPTLPLVVELVHVRDSVWLAAPNRLEVTVSGPSFNGRSGTVDVFAIVTSDRAAGGDGDHVDFVGAVQYALSQCILVKDYGTTGLVEIATIEVPESTGINLINIKPAPADEDQVHTTLQASFVGTYSE